MKLYEIKEIDPSAIEKMLRNSLSGNDINKDTKSVQDGDALEGILGTKGLLKPPFDLFQLTKIPENSSELGQIVEAMMINIEGFGGRYINRLDKEDSEKFQEELEAEFEKIDFIFNHINPDYDLVSIQDYLHYTLRKDHRFFLFH